MSSSPNDEAAMGVSPASSGGGGVGRETKTALLQRKLELLESRFTMPLVLPLPTVAVVGVYGAVAGSSPATLDPDTSSPATIPSSGSNHGYRTTTNRKNTCNNTHSATTTSAQNNNNSPHSYFGFDTPSLQKLNPTEPSKRISNSPDFIQYTAAKSDEPAAAATASMAAPDGITAAATTTTEANWQEITIQHMVKMAHKEEIDHNNYPRYHQNHPLLPNSSNSQDEHTLLTSHLLDKTSKNQSSTTTASTTSLVQDLNTAMDGGSNAHPSTPSLAVCVVQESPPFVPARVTAAAIPRKIEAPFPNHNESKKRKSVRPVKRNHHSIKDSTNAPSAPAVAQSGKNMKDGIAPAVVAAAAPRESSPRKRTRLQFVDIAVLPLPESSDDNNNTMDNVDALASALSKSRSNSPLMRGSSSTNSNMNNASNYNSNLLSPNANSSSRIRKLDGSSNHSRDPNGKTTGLSKKSVQLAKISDFFLSSKPKSKVEHSSKDALDPTTEPVQEIATMSTATTQPATTMVKPTSQPNPQLPPHRPSAPKLKNRQPQKENLNSQELELLQRRFDELQQTCREKDEQLKAVSNNRTIFHSALQSTIRQREQELRELQESTEEHEFKLRYALEEMVRTEATQKARELREKLAADTVRLGRVVSLPTPPSRGPPRLMQHRAGIETWEEGSAPKEVELKRLKLKEKRLTMEQRLSSALEAEKRFVQKMSDKEKEGQPDSSEHAIVPSEEVENDIEVGGIIIQSELDVREAIESTRFHLDTIRQQEQALKLTEQTLNDEKGAHVRALRRVANEDASRFQMRPKLHDRYVLCSLLGKGGFSEVWRAYDLNELREVAVKIHELDAHWPESKKENYTKHVSREYEIHRDVRHPRIVTLYDVFEIDTNAFATVLEACDGTDLDTLLKVKRRLPEKDAKAILLQILSGMNYLSHPSADGSRQGVIHYDLKPGNILFDETGDAKITDFGLSKIVDAPDPNESMELTSQGAGTYWYLPPECFLTEGNVRISNKVDVWSIGVIFYQMLFGKRPFGDGQTQDKILADGTMLNAHTVTFPERIAITNGASEFLRACLTYDQSFRPSIAQICQHAYVISATTTGS